MAGCKDSNGTGVQEACALATAQDAAAGGGVICELFGMVSIRHAFEHGDTDIQKDVVTVRLSPRRELVLLYYP